MIQQWNPIEISNNVSAELVGLILLSFLIFGILVLVLKLFKARVYD